MKSLIRKGWQARWTAYLAALPGGATHTPAQTIGHRDPAKLHAGASKATSSLITQIRIEKIGLNTFLSDRRVLNYSPKCPCG